MTRRKRAECPWPANRNPRAPRAGAGDCGVVGEYPWLLEGLVVGHFDLEAVWESEVRPTVLVSPKQQHVIEWDGPAQIDLNPLDGCRRSSDLAVIAHRRGAPRSVTSGLVLSEVVQLFVLLFERPNGVCFFLFDLRL